MENSDENYKCTHCDYKSKWKGNVRRHMVTKHTSPNVTDYSPNVTDSSPNVTVPSRDSNICRICTKIYSSKYALKKHLHKCKGTTNPLQCNFCLKTFKYRSNVSAHLKICKSTAIVVSTSEELPQSTIQQHASSITNNNTTNNNTINNVQNIININIQTPMVFKENTPYLFDHITKKTLKQLLKNDDYSELIGAFSKDVLRRCENQCVRKTNLRSSSSSVHVGNNVWEMHSDANVIPKVLCNLAITLSGSIEEYKVAAKATLETFIEDLTCYGEHGNEDKDEIALLKKLYKKTMADLKHNIFNITRQTVGAQKALAMLTDRRNG